jgi:hypothetical protein
MAKDVVPILDAKRAEKLIHELSADSSSVFVTAHAEERMAERGFTMRDLLTVLRSGSVVGQPVLTKQKEWKYKVVKRLRGSRDAGVITVVAKGRTLIIITMEWEDLP